MTNTNFFLRQLAPRILFVFLGAGAFGANVYVSPFGDDVEGQGTEALPFGTIQHAIDTATAGDTVIAAAGRYEGVGNRAIQFNGKALTLQSSAGAEATFLDGGDAATVLIFSAGDSSETQVVGFTIEHGLATYEILPSGVSVYRGGGIFCRDASPAFRDCVIQANAAIGGQYGIWENFHFIVYGGPGYGAGIYCENSAAQFSGCIIRNNMAKGGKGALNEVSSFTHIITPGGAGQGGGLFVTGASDVQTTNCVFQGNIASSKEGGDSQTVGRASGAGVQLAGGKLTLESCSINDNLIGGASDSFPVAGGVYGIGICASGGFLNVMRCAIRDNHLDVTRYEWALGGGIFVGGAEAMIRQCSITGNVLEHSSYGVGLGGGIALQLNYGPVILDQSLVSNNSASFKGGGVFADLKTTETAHMVNCTITDNYGNSTSGEIHAQKGKIDASFCTIGGAFQQLLMGEYGGSVRLYACIAQAGYSATASGGGVESLGFNVVSDLSIPAGTADLLGVDPLIGPLQDNGGPTLTRALLDGSIAIDHGPMADAPAVDQRNIARPFDGDGDSHAAPDIGAVELDHLSNVPVPTVTPTPTVSPTASPSATPSPTPTPLPPDYSLCFSAGGNAETFQGANRFRGNVYSVTVNEVLTEIRATLRIEPGVQGEIWFQVLDGTTASGVATPILATSVPVTGTGEPVVYSSGPISLQLQAGHFYTIGAAWADLQVTYYREPAQLPAAWEKGQILGSAILGNITPPIADPVDPGDAQDSLFAIGLCLLNPNRPASAGEITAYLLGGPASGQPMDLNQDGVVDAADVVLASGSQ